MSCGHLLASTCLGTVGILLLVSSLLCTKFVSDLGLTFFLEVSTRLHYNILLCAALAVGCLAAARCWNRAWIKVAVMALAAALLANSYYLRAEDADK